MSKSTFDVVRIKPRSQSYLERTFASSGEIYFNQTTNSLKVFNGIDQGGIDLARIDLANVSNVALLEKLEQAGFESGNTSIAVSNVPPNDPSEGQLWFDINSGILYVYYQDEDSAQWVQPSTTTFGGFGSNGASNNFSTISVAGQSNIVASSPADSLTFVAGSNITITTNPSTDAITINATAVEGTVSNSFTTIAVSGQSNVIADSSTDTLTLVAGPNINITTNATTDSIIISAATVDAGPLTNSFATIVVAGQNNVVADSTIDTLTLVAGSGINITTNATTDTITFTSTAVGSGVTTFTGLSDAAGLTVDEFFLPAITMLTVTNSGASAYRFDQYGVTNNPTVYAISATTIAFNLNIGGHPFLIQDGTGANYNTGLIHVTTSGVVTTEASAQGKTSGTLYWKIPSSISGTYRYQCSVHASMVGIISIKNIAVI